MKDNKKTIAYVAIFAVILLVVMVVALFLTKKNDDKDNNKAENNGNGQQQEPVKPVDNNGKHENLIKNLNSIEFNGKKIEIKTTENIEEGYKEISVDGTVVANSKIQSQLVGIYIYSDWLVFVEKYEDNYIIPIYNMKNKNVTEFSNIDGLFIYGYEIESNGILAKTKNHSIGNYLLIEDDDKVNYCNQAELNEKNISDTDRVEGNYQIILTEDNFDVNIIDESVKTLKDIKTNC